jgi:hypothetical protein
MFKKVWERRLGMRLRAMSPKFSIRPVWKTLWGTVGDALIHVSWCIHLLSGPLDLGLDTC